jgi:hypothetical protein
MHQERGELIITDPGDQVSPAHDPGHYLGGDQPGIACGMV